MNANGPTSPYRHAPAQSSGAWKRGGLLVSQPGIRDQLGRLVHSLTHDPNLYEDLLQEALLCLWRAEVENPGQTFSWFKQRCRFCVQDYLRKGRSVDALKHSRSAYRINEGEEFDLIADDDIMQEVCGRDLFTELLPHLTLAERQTLGLLREGMAVREIGRALHISHAAVIGRRRHIAAIAEGLGIHL